MRAEVLAREITDRIDLEALHKFLVQRF